MLLRRVECPKCGSESAYFKKDGPDVWLRCLCGYCRVVKTELESMNVDHTDQIDPVKLPRPHSKLWRCLVTLAAIAPANTHEIQKELNGAFDTELSVSDVASQLTVLRYKRLVFSGENRRGLPGGSTWVCTKPAMMLLGLK